MLVKAFKLLMCVVIFMDNVRMSCEVTCKYSERHSKVCTECSMEFGLDKLLEPSELEKKNEREKEAIYKLFTLAIYCAIVREDLVDDKFIANRESYHSFVTNEILTDPDSLKTLHDKGDECFDNYNYTKAATIVLFTCTDNSVISVCGKRPAMQTEK